MASLIGDKLRQAKDKLPGSGNTSPSPTRSSRDSVTERVIPPEPVQQAVNGDFGQHEIEGTLQQLNLARANKRCKALTWDPNLAKEAEVYAEELARTGIMEHSGFGEQGENLYMSADNANYEDAVNAWLNEEKKYHGEHIGEGNLADWGHFTQCVWHSTTRIGMGKARTKSGHTYIVGRYAPQGNIPGQRPFQP